MHLTRFTDYCLRVLIYLALHQERLCTVREVATAYGVSRNHLMKVVNALARQGYVEAVRGPGGGLRLGRPAAQIVVGEVVRHTEDDLRLVECFGPGNRCVITPSCRLKIVLYDALQAFLAELDRYRLSDMLMDERLAQRLLEASASEDRDRPPASPGT